MPTNGHQISVGESAFGYAASLFALAASFLGGMSDDLPTILRWLAFFVAITTIARNIVALWMKRP